MSKFDSIWPLDHINAAAAEGWLLAYTVDSGSPIESACLEVFLNGTKALDRAKLVKFIVHQARQGSKLHRDAMTVILASKRAST